MALIMPTFIRGGSTHTLVHLAMNQKERGELEVLEQVRIRMKDDKEFKYSVNIGKEDLIQIYVKQWVLAWCKKNHPEIFKKAEKKIKNILNKEGSGNVLDEKA